MDAAIVNYEFQSYVESLKHVIKHAKSFKCNEVSIAWRNLKFEVKEFGKFGQNKKIILNRLNGHFNSASLNGLLGPSGAGKTTLLNCLSGSDASGLTTDSEVYLNTSKQQSTVSYFIGQQAHENIIVDLTVGQIFEYAFAFKNGTSSKAEMEQHISEIMAALMLSKDLLTQSFARCSGGEQRRIAVGQELMALAAPNYIFCDEPTTGLDSATAFELVNCLQKLAKEKNITIISSIHAPNSETLNLFDQIYVLAKGGTCIYSGFSSQIQPYLEYHLQRALPPEQPPVEKLIQIACSGICDKSVQTLSSNCQIECHSGVTSQLHYLTLQPFGMPNPRKRFKLFDFLVQLRRFFWLTFITHYYIFSAQLFLTVLFYFLIATLFSPQMTRASSCLPLDTTNLSATSTASSHDSSSCSSSDINNSSLVMENICFLSYSFMFIGYLIICCSTQFFLPLVKVFKSEHRNYWYSAGVFYWSTLVLSVVQVACLALVMSCSSYLFTRQFNADILEFNWHRFSSYIFLIWLLCVYMETIGRFIGVALVDNVKIAIVFSQILYSFLCMLNGFYIEIDDTGSTLVSKTANLISIRFITQNVIYTIYGIDRCKETEFSWIMRNNSVKESEFYNNCIRVFINIVVIQLATLCVMLCKFSNLNDHPVTKLIRKCNEKHDLLELNQAIPLEIPNHQNTDKNLTPASEVAKLAVDEAEDKLTSKIIIGWKNLTLYKSESIYEMGSKSGTRQPILRNLNGQFRFATLNALMGASGSGKTSLLKVLNGRCKTRLSDETEIYLSKFAKIRTCFITQEVSGHLMLGLTAKQILIYASKLKNTQPGVDHEQIANKWLHELDLDDTVNTLTEHCSGGERKRLAVALELTSIEMPNLIQIDECTSGLDSNSAETVISILRKVVHKHCITIITSIHQPNTTILSQFDQLYFLARGGVCIYSGSTLPTEIRSSLKSISTDNCQYPLETLVKYSCLDPNNTTVKCLSSAGNQQLTNQLFSDTCLAPDGVALNRNRFSLHSIYILSQRYLSFIKGHLWVGQLFYIVNYLLFSFFLNRIFDPAIAEHSGCISYDASLNSTCFSSSSSETALEFKMITNNYRYSFYMTSICMFNLILNSALLFAHELELLKNEHRNGWYSTGSFYLVKCIFEILPAIPLMIIHVYICNIYSSVRPNIFWPLTALFILTAIGLQGFAHVFTLVSNGNLLILTTMSVLLYVALTMISNFFLPLANLHYFYQFASIFSIPRFIFEAFLLLQYSFGRCGHREVQSVLHIFNLKEEDFYFCVAMLVFNLILYRIITIYLLLYRLNPIENRKSRMAKIVKNIEHLKAPKCQIPGIDSNNEFHVYVVK